MAAAAAEGREHIIGRRTLSMAFSFFFWRGAGGIRRQNDNYTSGETEVFFILIINHSNCGE